MRTLPDVEKAEKEKRWRLGTVYRGSANSYRYAQAGVKLKNHIAVKLGDSLDDMWVVTPVNKGEDVHSVTELPVDKGDKFWLRDPDGITSFKIEVAK